MPEYKAFMSALPVVNALWIGPRMGPIHAACLRSFVRAGHRVVLHCYDPPRDVPRGVGLADARQVTPEEKLFRHKKTGSFAAFSDFFRYRVLQAELGVYVDCDVFCLRPIEDAEYIFGWQSGDSINGAVLKLPANSLLLRELCGITDGRPFVPPWFRGDRRRKYWLRSLLGFPIPIEAMPWGSVGPDAITWFARKFGVDHLAKPSDVFYPVAHYHSDRLFDPQLSIRDITTHRTIVIHLYNETFRFKDVNNIPAGSPLGEMISLTE